MFRRILLASAGLLALSALSASAQNPIIRDQFTADPSAHVFDGRVYVYASHDIPAAVDYPRKDWFCMEDYHVFSSDNLVDWVDHGMIIDQKNVPWVNPTSYSMWAPDCNYKNGKYYFYFPANEKPKPGARWAGNAVGVAISDTPYGPFVPEAEPMKGVGGIDPCCFVDDDGQAYLAWSGMGLMLAKLKDNMLEIDGDPISITQTASVPRGQTEGPYLFKANGKYYYTFPWVEKERECLAYAMSDKPMGPYKFMGKFFEQHPDNCWTNHHSVVNFKGQWYIFYHHNDYSPRFDKNRSVCVDEIHFNPDGTIQMVQPTLRGVGITDARTNIHIDRYSDILKTHNAEIAYINADRAFDGWKVIFSNSNQNTPPFWVRYDRVDFSNYKLSTAVARVFSLAGGKLEIRVDAVDGPLLATIGVNGAEGWAEAKAILQSCPSGVHDLYVMMTDGSRIDIDWVSFK